MWGPLIISHENPINTSGWFFHCSCKINEIYITAAKCPIHQSRICGSLLLSRQWKLQINALRKINIWLEHFYYNLIWLNWKLFCCHCEFLVNCRNSYYSLLSLQKVCRIRNFFFSVCCPSVMSFKPLFEWSQLQLSCKFTTVGI